MGQVKKVLMGSFGECLDWELEVWVKKLLMGVARLVAVEVLELDVAGFVAAAHLRVSAVLIPLFG